MQNGTRKGGAVATYQVLESSPGLEDIWQLHWSYNVGVEGNPAGLFIANVDEPSVIAQILTAPPRGGGPGPGAGAPGPGTAPADPAAPGRQGGGGGRGGGTPPHTGPASWIKISAQADGTFTVTNSRNGFSRIYKAR
jgi:hypothetical protein